jgi:zinc/manganese transport system permease protein
MSAPMLATGTGLGQLFAHPFMRNAFLAGTAIAVVSGLVGYFVVLRAQVFSGDALSHVAFTGAFAALAIGVDARIGLFGACVAVGVGLGLLGNRGRADDVVVGTVFTWVLGLGVLFLSIYTTSSATANSAANVNVLFGSIFGLSGAQARLAALIAVGLAGAMLVIARPLLFASIDEDVAAARGVPVRALGVCFLALLGVCAAEATQAVGALLLLGLLAAPAGAAQRCTNRPYLALALSVAFAVGAMWVGLTSAYLFPRIPPSFAIVAGAATCYLLVVLVPLAGRRMAASRERPARRVRPHFGSASGS